ncbi:hypothetical protein BS47DRAFT_1338505 [Hydnum rufescens UP504]|uniref:Uncharacterized protein n=1 Tax=Hydnum rufescens UP504 TaxID=1448309 RepID=A0A9P6B5R3_9AGAM|nr:hypothetical protein BS47DRAFT_1338505 [Hydnum rufescens UP504]
MSSAAATPSFNAVIGLSRAHRSAGPLRIQFTSGWQSTRIMEWHHSLGSRPTKIDTLQLRKEKSEPFTHQYVVLILSDDSILRLDRRGDENNPMDAVKSDGIESVDTIADVDSLSDLDVASHCLAEFHCQASDLDLSHIIKICFGIHKDPKAGRYTLQRFNCYFFAWTILVATARYAEPWDTFPFDSPWRTLSQTLADALSTKYADALINTIVDGAVMMITAIQFKLKPQLWRAVSWRARLAWAMPQWLIRLALRLMFRASGRSRVYPVLRSRLRPALLSALQPTLQSALADLRVSTLRTTLWKDDIEDAVRDAARQDVIASLLNAGTEALSSIRLTMEDLRSLQPLAVTFADETFFKVEGGDWPAAAIAAFHAMTQAARLFAAHGADGFMTDDAKWDEVWSSIRDSVRDAVEDAMKGVEEGGWAALWDALMEEWVAAWELIRPKMRDTSRGSIKEMADLVNDALAYSVVKTLPDTHIHIAWGYTVPSPGLADLADSELQPYVLKLIQEHGSVVGRYKLGSPAKVERDMQEAMDRVWRAVVELEQGGVDANGNADVS